MSCPLFSLSSPKEGLTSDRSSPDRRHTFQVTDDEQLCFGFRSRYESLSVI